MTAEPDLLPCPGCNGASVRVIGGPGTKGGPQYWAGCDYCRWRTWGNTEAEAIAAWNRRATAARDAEVEALRAEVDLRDSVIATHAADTREYQKRISQAEARADKLRAEVEMLTFELERLQQQYDERTACMIVHRGSALACSAAVRAAYSEEHERAERLAEALRRYRNEVPLGHQPHMLAHVVDDMLNPTAAQENDDA